MLADLLNKVLFFTFEGKFKHLDSYNTPLPSTHITHKHLHTLN